MLRIIEIIIYKKNRMNVINAYIQGSILEVKENKFTDKKGNAREEKKLFLHQKGNTQLVEVSAPVDFPQDVGNSFAEYVRIVNYNGFLRISVVLEED